MKTIALATAYQPTYHKCLSVVIAKVQKKYIINVKMMRLFASIMIFLQ